MVKKNRADVDDGGVLHWPQAAEVQLLTLMADYLSKNPDSKIRHRQWKKWAETLPRTLGQVVPFDKLTSKRDRFAKDYKIFKKFRDQSGVGSDPVNNRFDCDEDTLEAFVQVFMSRHVFCYDKVTMQLFSISANIF